MQLSFNKGWTNGGRTRRPEPTTLGELKEGESGVLERLDLPDDVAQRLMEMGFLPGHVVVPARRAPGGGPRVFQVDGSEVALRKETAVRLILRKKEPSR